MENWRVFLQERKAHNTEIKGEVIELIEAGELVVAQQEVENLKDHILHIEANLAKERAEAERVKSDLAQALDENRRLKDLIETTH